MYLTMLACESLSINSHMGGGGGGGGGGGRTGREKKECLWTSALVSSLPIIALIIFCMKKAHEKNAMTTIRTYISIVKRSKVANMVR